MQQEEGRQLAESIELSGPLNQRIKEVLKIKDEAPSLISYPSSESLQEFKSDEIDLEQYWYYAVKAEKIKKKMNQATRAFHERDEYHKDPKLCDSLYAEYTKQVEGLQYQLKAITGILSVQKTDTGMYEYPSSPSLVLHLGELDDKPKEYFEKTKKEVSRKNSLAKWVHQHKMQNVNTSDDEREVEQEYQKFKKKQNQVSSICDKKIQEFEEQDYLSLKGSKSVSDPINEEEIKVQYVKPIGENTLPPQYSKEISRYQSSEKERVKAMKDALSAVRQFTSEGNLSRNGNLNTTTMKEMWDYESQELFSGKIRDISEKAPERSRGSQAKSNNECELCGGNHKVEQCPHERKFSLGMDTTSPDSKEKLPDGKSKSVDCSKTRRKQPTIWRPAQSINGITNLVKYHHTRGTLTLENLLELDPRKDQLGVGHKQILLDSKTKAWVDEQNRMNKEKTLGYDKSRKEAKDTKHPDPRINIEPSTKSLKRGTVITSEKDTPQPTCALQEFVKHIADPLVNKGWYLHLKFGKGESQGEQFVQGSSPQESTAKTDKREKVSKPQVGSQIPLEMGTGGGGGGGKKGGNGSKRPHEDKIDIENPSGEGDEDDSSLETSLELNLDPQQLASVRLDRPQLKLSLTPRRRRVITTAPGGGGTPPPMGGGIVTMPLLERQNGIGINQPIESGGGPPQPPNGVGGGTWPLLSERDRRIPQQPAGGGGTPPPNGNGNGNGDSNGSRGGDRPPPPKEKWQ